nr:MAG TPA: terminase small subunit [Caudoviricetes sp.]
MARARSPNSIEAEDMYKNGMKLVDIAKKLDVPASTVRRWKYTELGRKDKRKEKRTFAKEKSERSP